MKNSIILLSITISLMLVDTTRALKCFSCLAATSSANCQSIEECPDTNYCYMIQATVLGVSTYSKGCLAACATTSTGTDSTGSKTTCCQTDNCNSGALRLGSGKSFAFLIISMVMARFYL